MKLQNAVRKLIARRDELQTALGDAIGTIERYEADAPTLESLQTELEGIYGTIREGTHRAAFDDAAGKLRVDPEMLDLIYEAMKLDTTKDEPDSKAIRSALKEFTAKRPKLILDPADNDDDDDEGRMTNGR